jgi:predicted PurR-regulated permease PerM
VIDAACVGFAPRGVDAVRSHTMDESRTDAEGPARKTPESAGAPDVRSLHLWQIQSVRDVLVIALVAGLVYVGYALRTVTVPLLIALALAYLVEPVVSRMSRWRRMSRPIAVGLILAALGVLVSVLLAIVVPLAVGQTLSFADSLRSGRYDGAVSRAISIVPEEYRADVQEWVDRAIHPASREQRSATEASHEVKPEPDRAHVAAQDAPAAEADRLARPDDAAVREAAREAVRDAEQRRMPPSAVTQVSLDNPIVSVLGAGAGRAYAIGLWLLQLGLVLFLIPFYFYYFSVHWPSIMGFLSSLVPDENRGRVGEIVSEMDRAVAGFVRGRIVICTIMGAMFAIGWQVCGVPYGIALGLLTGFLSIVPYLGGVGLPFAVALLVADQYGLPAEARMALWQMLFWPTIVFVVVQTVEGYLLTPVIAGKATNLDPVTIVVAILAGGSIAGVYGMLLAIPIAACGKIAARRLLLPRIQDWARGRVSDPLPIDSD